MNLTETLRAAADFMAAHPELDTRLGLDVQPGRIDAHAESADEIAAWSAALGLPVVVNEHTKDPDKPWRSHRVENDYRAELRWAVQWSEELTAVSA